MSGFTIPDYYFDEDGEIANLSSEITKGLSTDYDKCKAIHDWVCKNIWYDLDAVNVNKDDQNAVFRANEAVKAINVLSTKRSVCDGYANLTVSLLREAGIPAKKIMGYALDYNEKWTKELTEINSSLPFDKKINHSWVEAYVDGKWIFIDTTWDSQNKYENGKFGTQKTIKYDYFNPTIENFSKNHKIVNNDTDNVPAAGVLNLLLETKKELEKLISTYE